MSKTVTVILTIDYKAKGYLTAHGEDIEALHSPHYGEKLEVRVSLLDLLVFEGSKGKAEARAALEHCGRVAFVRSDRRARRHSNLGNLAVTVRSFRVKDTGAFLFVMEDQRHE